MFIKQILFYLAIVKNIDNVCISMNNSIITRVRATKFLGVITDEKLTWKDHI